MWSVLGANLTSGISLATFAPRTVLFRSRSRLGSWVYLDNQAGVLYVFLYVVVHLLCLALSGNLLRDPLPPTRILSRSSPTWALVSEVLPTTISRRRCAQNLWRWKLSNPVLCITSAWVSCLGAAQTGSVRASGHPYGLCHTIPSLERSVMISYHIDRAKR